MLPLTRKQTHHLRQLKTKKYRLQTQEFLVEGEKSVFDLLSSDYTTRMVVATPECFAANQETLSNHSLPIHLLPATELAQVSALKTNHKILAVAAMHPNNPLTIQPGQRALVLDTIKDPGNLGTIMRIADWYGITQLICSPTTVDRYNSKVIQASMGSFTQVKSYYTPLLPYLQQTQLPIIGTIVDSPHYLHQTTLPPDGLLLIGNESRGIHPSLRPLLHQQVTIQPHGKADSLNAAIATAIVCQHWLH